MKDKKLPSTDYQIFLFKALFLAGMAWAGFAMALGWFFYTPLILAAAIALGGGLAYYFMFRCNYPTLPSGEMLMVMFISLIIVILFSFYSTPTVFSGRDQGSISEAAIRLVQNHTFEFSTPASSEFFKIYGPGKALNFPGFYYTEDGNLTTQFPLVYIVWLALFYSLFGIAGFIIANAVLLFIFLVSFYLLSRLFLNTKSSLITFSFAATSFSFMWFSKFTLSENMALPFLWLSVLALMLFLKGFRKLYYFTFLVSSALLAFIRIEGIAFLAVLIIVALFHQKSRKFIAEKVVLRFFLPAIIFIAFFIANILKDLNFYREIAKAFLSSFTSPQAKYLGVLENITLPAFYTDNIFLMYGLLGFFITGAAGICFYIYKRETYKLIPFFVVLPTFIYFFDSHITNDHPWMLRRFMFSLLPAGIFYAGLFLGQCLENKKGKKIKIASALLTVGLIAFNLPAFLNYLNFSEDKNLLKQTEALAKNFSSRDLILIDRETTSDGWNMISGPMSSLYGKNAVYFFNTNDLQKLDLNKFKNVYLLAPDNKVSFYMNSTIGSRLELKNDYSLNFSKLNIGKNDIFSFPEKKEIFVSGKIFIIKK